MSRGAQSGGAARALVLSGLALVVLLATALGAAGLAAAERTQYGDLIVALDGGLAPLALPRDRPAPVAVTLEGGLTTAGDALLPRVTKVELGLPDQGVLSTQGLPTCPRQRLRNTTSAEALAGCGPALVGRGRLRADVLLPNQSPFSIHSRLLAFNGRLGARRVVFLHAAAADPPSVAVLPVFIGSGSGRFKTVLSANLPPSLGPWPRFAHFELRLSRRYDFRGQRRSYLSASCPIPRRFTAGFFSFARATFTLAGGRRVSTGIARGCRAR